MTTQPQLLPLSLNAADVVYTPDWVAKDMVDWFKPTGEILEPSAGDGVFLRYLPAGTHWCEIERGRDFFAWRRRVDWIVGNPPYGAIFNDWMRHSFGISNQVLYVLPLNKLFNSEIRWRLVHDWGGINHIRLYGGGSALGWGYGYPVGAIHFSKHATCTTYSTYEGDK